MFLCVTQDELIPAQKGFVVVEYRYLVRGGWWEKCPEEWREYLPEFGHKRLSSLREQNM